MTGSRFSRRFRAAAPWLVLLPMAGCEQVTKLDQMQGGGLPCEVQRIFSESCAITGNCHDGAQAPDLREGAAATSIESQATQASIPYVEVGNLAGSYLAVKIMDPRPEGAPPNGGTLMPNLPGELSDGDRALLVGWMSGAPLEACGGSGGDDGTMPTTGGSDDVAGDSTTGPPAPVACGIDDLDNGGTIKPIDAGDAPGQIPSEIGDILAGNCGCHFTDMVIAGFPIYSPVLPLDMTTLDGFSAELPQMIVASDKVSMRLQGMGGQIMPNPPCMHESGGAMDPALRDTLLEWLAADTPDGATWMGGM